MDLKKNSSTLNITVKYQLLDISKLDETFRPTIITTQKHIGKK